MKNQRKKKTLTFDDPEIGKTKEKSEARLGSFHNPTLLTAFGNLAANLYAPRKLSFRVIKEGGEENGFKSTFSPLLVILGNPLSSSHVNVIKNERKV